MGLQAGKEFIFLLKINLLQGLQVGQVRDFRALCCAHFTDEHVRLHYCASGLTVIFTVQNEGEAWASLLLLPGAQSTFKQ